MEETGHLCKQGLHGRLLRLRDAKLNNNPPAGDLESDSRCNPTVDAYIGEAEDASLLVLVVFPPFTKLPVLQGQTQLFPAAQIKLIEDAL